MLADWCLSPDIVHGILLVSTFCYFITNITSYCSFWILLNITINAGYYSILPTLLNIINITQYYSILLNITQYHTMLQAKVILE